MKKCASCGAEISETSRFCSSCGASVNSDALATRTVGTLAPATPRSAGSGGRSPGLSVSSTSSSGKGSRLASGAMLAGRYRIIALLGKGGMGEVYRADDLTLEQPVALKFLPDGVAANESALARFHNEVRIARQVSHPNVCRVYDVGEMEGHVFLSMEYVDGEDLASLMRRIGRLPADKGVEIARKLCAGLAAAHEKGVLHRDLKPSNIMLDARGQVLLTDFGLAGLAAQISGAEVRNGTPAYMAPEQIAGKEVTTQSDIYALGLVLYEIFTGKRPFEANSMAELARVQTETTPTSLTSLVRDLDPAVERVILRCLDPEPSRRPPSALAVAAALPGGDPLAAALAAGETPSPKMVAAAGQGVGLRPGIAIALLGTAILGLGAYYLLEVRRSALERIAAPYSEEVLLQKARDLVRTLGFTSPPADEAYHFGWTNAFLQYAESHDKPTPDWNKLLAERPVPLQFSYRQSPYPLTALSYHSDLLTPGIVDHDDPPPELSGMIDVELDAQGRLLRLERVPEQEQMPASSAAEMDWKPLFDAAGLDRSKFQSTEPLWTSLGTSDTRVAWTGTWPESGRPLRVEAAALRGSPVAFSLISPWTEPSRMPKESSAGQRGQFIILVAITLAIFFGGGWLSRRNLAQGRGDREGAWRLAIWIGWVQMALWVSDAHFNTSIGTFAMFLLAICTAVFYGFVIYVMYIALEPQMRRRWPRTLISWSAILTGQWRDPIVGRDVLVGVVFGVGLSVFSQVVDALALGSSLTPHTRSTNVLSGFRSTLAIGLQSLPRAIRGTLMIVLILFLLRALLRNQWVAGAAFAVVFAMQEVLVDSHPVIDGAESFVVYALIAFVAWRFGLLAVGVWLFSNNLIDSVQATLHSGAWYLGENLFLLACVLGLAAWGCYTSMAGQKLWKTSLLEA
jgi:predicted Ser/Thr protein kinase